jgi:hypothetical protein
MFSRYWDLNSVEMNFNFYISNVLNILAYPTYLKHVQNTYFSLWPGKSSNKKPIL